MVFSIFIYYLFDYLWRSLNLRLNLGFSPYSLIVIFGYSIFKGSGFICGIESFSMVNPLGLNSYTTLTYYFFYDIVAVYPAGSSLALSFCRSWNLFGAKIGFYVYYWATFYGYFSAILRAGFYTGYWILIGYSTLGAYSLFFLNFIILGAILGISSFFYGYFLG